MKETVHIPYGLDSSGRLVHVDDVPNGKNSGASCPSCNAPLIAKNAGAKKAHHFAHGTQVQSCEGWLHAAAKYLLHQRITDSLNGDRQLRIQWTCTAASCRSLHRANLLGDTSLSHALIEHRLAIHHGISTWNIQPDITCMAGEAPRFLIEIVDTHPPESPVIAAGLPVLQFNVADGEDLDKLANGESLSVSAMHNRLCPDPICPTCKRRARQGCLRCDKCGGHHPTDDWRYCSECGTCVEDQQGQFGGHGDHIHCRYCGELVPSPNGYGSHYCCWIARKHDIPVCRDKDDWGHRHCQSCGVRVTKKNRWGDYFETCYTCHRRAVQV